MFSRILNHRMTPLFHIRFETHYYYCYYCYYYRYGTLMSPPIHLHGHQNSHNSYDLAHVRMTSWYNMYMVWSYLLK